MTAVRAINRENPFARFALVAISVAGLSLFAYSVHTTASGELNSEWVLLSLVTIMLVSRVDTGLHKTSSALTLSDTFVFISILLYGPYLSVVLAGVDAAASSLQHKSRRALVWFDVAVRSLAVFVSSYVVSTILVHTSPLEVGLDRLGLAAGALGLVHFAFTIMVIVLVGTQGLRGSPTSSPESWRETVLWATVSHIGGSAAACLIIQVIEILSFYVFIVAIPIVMITYLTYKVYLDKIEASDNHAEQMAELHLRTIEALAIAIDAKDEVTHDHVRRVQIYATGLARLFGLSDDEVEALRAGALLHDIGKLAVPDYILNKPGTLTPAEFEKMKIHTTVGADILARVRFPYPVVPIVKHHHERWDGTGYPDGLKGDEIPIVARILAVADTFDAVREHREYRRAMTRLEAIRFLKESSGTVFDPNVVSIFLDHLDEFEGEIRTYGIDLQANSQFQRRGDKTPAAVEEVTPYERIRSAHREVLTLYEIAQTIGTSLDLRDTFAVFAARLQDIVSYTTCVLYLQLSESTEVEAAYVTGRYTERLKGLHIAAGAGITGWVVANRHPMHNCDPRLDFDAMKTELPELYKTASVVPLVKDGEVLGALALYSAELVSYEPDHFRLLEAVAKLASDAIANAVHHEEAATSALTDALTGLPNARALRYKFEEQLDRAERHRDAFSLVMMDLDGLKAINDKLGHQAGDLLVREVGRLLQGLVRSSDFVSRYAGDEFVAILQIGPDEVNELVKRIQNSVDNYSFRFGNFRGSVGLSVGWACYGTDGSTLDELLIAADRAMYMNKARRRAAQPDNGTGVSSDLVQYLA